MESSGEGLFSQGGGAAGFDGDASQLAGTQMDFSFLDVSTQEAFNDHYPDFRDLSQQVGAGRAMPPIASRAWAPPGRRPAPCTHCAAGGGGDAGSTDPLTPSHTPRRPPTMASPSLPPLVARPWTSPSASSAFRTRGTRRPPPMSPPPSCQSGPARESRRRRQRELQATEARTPPVNQPPPSPFRPPAPPRAATAACTTPPAW